MHCNPCDVFLNSTSFRVEDSITLVYLGSFKYWQHHGFTHIQSFTNIYLVLCHELYTETLQLCVLVVADRVDLIFTFVFTPHFIQTWRNEKTKIFELMTNPRPSLQNSFAPESTFKIWKRINDYCNSNCRLGQIKLNIGLGNSNLELIFLQSSC